VDKSFGPKYMRKPTNHLSRFVPVVMFQIVGTIHGVVGPRRLRNQLPRIQEKLGAALRINVESDPLP